MLDAAPPLIVMSFILLCTSAWASFLDVTFICDVHITDAYISVIHKDRYFIVSVLVLSPIHVCSVREGGKVHVCYTGCRGDSGGGYRLAT